MSPTKPWGPQAGQKVILSGETRLVFRADEIVTGEGWFVVLTTGPGHWLAGLLHCLRPGSAGRRRYRTAVYRANPGSTMPQGSPLLAMEHPDTETGRTAHREIADHLRQGVLCSRVTLERLEAVLPSLDQADAAMAAGEVAGAIAELDRALSTLAVQDPDGFFFPAYQALYLMRAAAWERVDRRRAVEAYRAFIETCTRIPPTPETVSAASVARNAMDWLRGYGRETPPKPRVSSTSGDERKALLPEAPAPERGEGR